MRLFEGQRAWVLQRVTALLLLALLALGAAVLLTGPALGYERWHEVATSTHGAVLVVVFFAAMCLHGWIGVRDVILDYIHPPVLRLSLLALIAVMLAAIVVRVLLTMATHYAGAA